MKAVTQKAATVYNGQKKDRGSVKEPIGRLLFRGRMAKKKYWGWRGHGYFIEARLAKSILHRQR